MMPEPVKKSHAYAKRNSTSISAPIVVDSDSDFAPGAYVEEKKPKKRTKKRGSTSNRRGSPSENISKSPDRDFAPRPKQRRKRPVALNEPNPLLEYFANEKIELQSASEADDDEEEKWLEERHSDMSDKNEDRRTSPPPKRRTSPEAIASSSAAPKPKPPKPIVVDDSATESDSEWEREIEKEIALKRKAPEGPNDPHKRRKTTPAADDSVTESDSGEEIPMASLPPGKERPSPDDDSATESESDLDLDPDMTFDPHPRPGFPLGPDQSHLPPLILDKDQGIKVPGAINTYLRPYQRDGIQFFWRQYNDGRGGLLGDDMGLGKTIQVISFLSAIMKKEGVITDYKRRKRYVSKLQDGKAWKKRRQLPPANSKWPTCLIIAPSTVCHNWEREFATWGYFEVGMYNGNRKEREPVLHDFKMGRLDVVITTFDLARRDIDILDDLPWSCVIIDEVHRVKNESSKATNAFHQFACQIRFGLTGTTIQNSYKEMWTILDWTNPGRLGTSRQWNGYVTKPLALGQSAGSTEEERAKAQVVALVLRDKLLPKFFLRRTKDIIKDQLPKKMDQVVFCPLTAQQISAYKSILNMEAVQNLINRDEPCPCESRKSRKTCCHPFVPGDLFKFMSILIKLSNHLGLILPGPKDTVEQTQRNRVISEIAFPDGDVPKYGVAMMQPQYCGKWATLEILLKEWRKDATNKVLIFTKSVKLLEMLEFHLSTKGYGFLKLDGSTKQSDRMPMIDKFHSDKKVFVFLISTLAGGTGLNLTGANKVVIFDPNWNPAHDLQAMDRAFRFGQTRDVSVYRLLGAGSVEELIYARQIYKQQQMAIGYEASVQTRYFKGVQGDNTKRGELFGLENIFRLHEDKLATKMAIEKANLAELDWALANLGGSRTKKQANPNSEVLEAEAKFAKEDAGLRGLGALLFDDDVPATSSGNTEQDAIQRTLNTIGVQYSHMNDEILAPSRIEEERTKRTIVKTRRKVKDHENNAAPPEPEWPPRRRHHKTTQPPANPAEQLASRYQAIIEMGMVNSPADVPIFAREFTHLNLDEQRQIIAELDSWVKASAGDD